MAGSVGEIAAKFVLEDEEAIRSLQKVNNLASVTQKTFRELSEEGKRFVVSVKGLEAVSPVKGAAGAGLDQATAQTKRLGEETKKAGEEGAEAQDKLSKEYARQIGIIEQLEIDLADLKIARTNATNPEDVAKLNDEYSTTQQRLNEVLATTNRQTQGAVELRKGLAGTRQEISRGASAMFGLVLLLDSIDGSKGESEVGKIGVSIRQSASAAFGLIYAMNLIGGTAATMALPVGIAVGAITLLTSAMAASNKVAGEAADEGLKEYTDILAKIPKESRPVIHFNVKEEVARVKKEIEGIYEAARVGIRGETILTVGAEERLKTLREELEILESRLKTTGDQVEKDRLLGRERVVTERTTRDHLPVVAKLDAEILKLKEEQLQIDKDSDGWLGRVRQKSDEIAAKEKERAELLATTSEQFEAQIAIEEQRVSLGTQTVDSLEEGLRLMLAQTEDEELRLSILEKIKGLDALRISLLQEEVRSGKITTDEYEKRLRILSVTSSGMKEQAAIAAELTRLGQERVGVTESRVALGEESVDGLINELTQLYALTDEEGRQLLGEKELLEIRLKILALLKAQTDAEKKLADEVAGAATTAIDNVQKRAEAEEALRHTRAMSNIEAREEAEREAGTLTAEDEEKYDSLRAAEVKKHNREIFEQRAEYEQTLADLRISLMPDEADQIKARHEEEMKALRDRLEMGEIGLEEFDLRRRDLERQTNEDLRALDSERTDAMIASIDSIGSALHRAFARSGDTFILKLLSALQIALEIQKAIQAAQLTSGIGAFLGPLAAFIPIFSLFEKRRRYGEGGQVPDGSFVVNREQSKRHEGLLNILGATEVTGGVPGKDSVPAQTRSGHKMLLMPGERILPPGLASVGEMINEGRVQALASGGFTGKGQTLGSFMSVSGRGNLLNFGVSTSNFKDLKYREQDLTPIISELRALRVENQSLRATMGELGGAGGPIQFSGKLDISNGSAFLEREMPGYEDFRRKKVVG